MSSSEEFLTIETPENVTFGYEVVGIGSRFIAGIIDSAIIGSAIGLLILLVFWLFRASNAESSSIFLAIGFIIGFAILWGYYIFFEMLWNGRSPGKRIAGLRVIKQDGTPISLSESIIRNLVRTIDSLPALYGLGIITMFIDDQSRRLGDIMAGTLVVRDSEDISLASLTAPRKAAPANATIEDPEEEANRWPVQFLTEADIRLAEEFLSRRYQLNNAQKLGHEITLKLLKKMKVPASNSLFMSNPINALDSIVREFRRN